MDEHSPIIASEQKYRTLFELASDAILTVRRPGGDIMDANLAAERLLGYAKNALQQLNSSKIIAPEVFDETQREWMAQVEARGFFHLETVWVCADGSRVPVAVSGKPLKIKNEVYFQLIGRDITEQKQREQELKDTITNLEQKEAALRESQTFLQTIFEHSLNAIIVADDQGNYRMVNQAAAEMFGYSVEQLQSMNVGQLTTADQPDAEKRYQRYLAQGQDINEFAFIHANGETRISQYYAVRIAEDINLSILADITERKRLEAEQQKLSKLESLGILAGGIAHDFNNLLTGLFSNVELAKMLVPVEHRAQKHLSLALKAMDIAVHLTQQLLTFAKGGEPVKQTLPIADVISESAQFSLRGSPVKLKMTLQPDLWLVEADKGQLSQVISNLVINAQQAMPLGGNIIISAKNVASAEGKFVVIDIEDEGVGIAPQYLDKIFDPYFSTKQTGSGLGLAVVYSIVHKHNGRIQVESRLGEGTTFTIQLPASSKLENHLAAYPVSTGETASGSPLHILVLEDEALVREALGDMLKAMGYEVSYATEGQEAIADYQAAYVQDTPYNLVLVDLTIPGGIGGQKAAEEILKIDPQAKLIVSSGYANDPVMAHYETYGFQGVIAKPYRFAELQQAIEHVLMA